MARQVQTTPAGLGLPGRRTASRSANGRAVLKGGVFCVLWLGWALSALGQKGSPWRSYKLGDGLPESACISVTVGPQGKIVARHANLPSVSELDGYLVNVIPAPEIGNGRVYGSPAGQLWTVVPEGLQEFRSGVWVLHPVPEIAAEFEKGSSRVIDPVPLFPVRQGMVLLLLPDRLLEFTAEPGGRNRTRLLRAAGQTGLGGFNRMGVARDGGLWISGRFGLARTVQTARALTPDGEWREYLLPPELKVEQLLEPREDEQGSVTVIGESLRSRQRVVVVFDSGTWKVCEGAPERLRQAWPGPDQRIWACTIEALFRYDPGLPGFVEADDISARQYLDVGQARGGAFWLATSDGLFRYAPLAWNTPAAIMNTVAPVNALTADRAGRLWFATGNALHLLVSDQHKEFSFPAARSRSLQTVRAIYALASGGLLLDAGEACFEFDPEQGSFKAVIPPGASESARVLGELQPGVVCLEEMNPGPGGERRLRRYDGSRFEELPALPPGAEAAGNLSRAIQTRNGDIWLVGENTAALWHENAWRLYSGGDRSVPGVPMSLLEAPEGKLWAATRDQVWTLDGSVWTVHRGGFDKINRMIIGRDGSVWVASNSGLHRYFHGAWVENGIEEGLPSASIRDVCEDDRGRIWAATTRGVSLYNPAADTDPPRVVVHKVPEGQNVPDGAVVSLSFAGQDKWKQTPRERLLYSYRLDGGDWSGFQEADATTLQDLPAGKHFFQVRAMDRNSNVDPNPAQIEFTVVLPWYKETRLLLISAAGLAVALFFAGLAFNRHWQLLKSYAEVERKVADRTRELEQANRELLQSQKMRALGTLAAGVAHDFNNILSIIKGSAQIIEDSLDDKAKVRIRLDRIKTVIEQGSGIVRAMLGFSRDSDQQPAVCDVNNVVEDTIKLLGDRFLREVEVRFSPGTGLPPAPAMKDFIQQILLNFIFNAADAMTRGKHLVLATRRMEALPAEMVLAPRPATGYLGISVQDFGSGIAPEILPRIFEPFFTTKAMSSRRGTGLGLSMVYELAKKLGAGLSVVSTVGVGSTFTLILPLQPEPQSTGTGGAAPQLPEMTATARKPAHEP